MKKIDLDKKGKFLLAISGGVDSVFLSYLFAKKYDKKDIIIAHFNHNLRWKESDFDENFVKKISENKWIKFYSKKTEKNIKNEEEARDLRYDFLFDIFKKEKCDYLVTAQHKNDQSETLFFQLIRWTWAFSPMKKISENKIYRPFLDITKKEILEFVKKENINWREDSSNKENIYTRNILRNKIIPEIEKINPNFSNAIINFSEISFANANFIKNESKKLLQNWKISKRIFDNLDISLKRGVIKFLNKNLSFKNISEVLEMIKKWIWKKEKHSIFLENGIIFFNKNNEKNTNFNQIILASQSPQRKRLLANITENFLIIPSKFEEIWDKKKSIEENVVYFSEWKALEISRKYDWKKIIWCDTFVIHPKFWNYFKPKNINEAKKQLLSYSWEKIRIISWISVLKSENKKIKKISKIVNSYVFFDEISEKDVENWLSKNEWQWRSWSCSIEWYASNFIKKIDWCFFNIIWLPVSVLRKMLK